MRKIKWGNVLKAIALVSSVGVLVYLLVMLMIGASLTYLGCMVSVICLGTVAYIDDDFREQLKKIPNGRNVKVSIK